jgi:hypothetical protein
MLGAWRDHGRLDANCVGAFGFSAGGLTLLVAASGESDFRTLPDHCKAHPAFEDCSDAAGSRYRTHDPRIRAVVSAPALGLAFGSLSSGSLFCLPGLPAGLNQGSNRTSTMVDRDVKELAIGFSALLIFAVVLVLVQQ